MNDSERISWIIKAKDKGIVQFFDKKSEKKDFIVVRQSDKETLPTTSGLPSLRPLVSGSLLF